jgi:hypothetical protein
MKNSAVRFVVITILMLGSGCTLLRFVSVPHENLAVETREPIQITLEHVQEPTSIPAPVEQIEVPVITTKEINREGEAPRYIIQIRYPQIDQVGPQPNQFNDQVEQMMNAFVDSFLQDIQNGEYDEILSEFTNGLSTDYRPTYVDSKQISILFVQSVYYAGAAHPLPFSQTINYDLWKDRALRLEDLFVENTDYLARISEYATNDLRQQGVLEWEEGASPSVDNFSNWNITLEGLQFTFDPYQVAPYAAGFQEVLIPYEVIRDILREGGPVPPLDYE